jgi:hypothetical protein
VEDFGALAFEAGAFACGHDGDGEFWGVHGEYGLMAWVLDSFPEGRMNLERLVCWIEGCLVGFFVGTGERFAPSRECPHMR